MLEMKEWTLMFYFASDNPLAPGIISHLKALKNAGYHPDVNVIAYFDPEPFGAPAHVFDINAINKLEDPTPNIGFDSNDPFVRNLMLDKLWGDEVDRDGKPIREQIQRWAVKPGVTFDRPKPPNFKRNAPVPQDAGHVRSMEQGPADSLRAFLDFCSSEYKAKHYMLFLLGHGLVVGDDVFMFDEHADTQSVTLRELGQMLEKFKADTRHSEFELVSFHSCSMSSLEVAYELQDTAKYMLASQGPAFVGSWPYTQILIRLFNDLESMKTHKQEINVEEMLGKIFSYVLHNSTDFILAGYSFDLSLCDLDKITEVKRPLKDLSAALSLGLNDSMVRNCILLAHLKSQSYWQENYTDLYDFCFCLRNYCEEFEKATGDDHIYQKLIGECNRVMAVLMKQHGSKTDNPDNPIVKAEFAGPDSQYSHGFSIFFPWTRPVEDRAIMQEYAHYKFNATGWFDFLDKYWGPQNKKANQKEFENSTMRLSHSDENDPIARVILRVDPYENLLEDIASLMFNTEGPLNIEGALSDPPPKTSPPDPTGDVCTCGSIKNYLRDTRALRKRSTKAKPSISFSSEASQFLTK